MKNEVKKYIKKKRKRDKREKLGIIERITLSKQAKQDGGNGLPAKYENETIYSSTIDKELRSFDESLKEIEVMILDSLEALYTDVYDLSDSIVKAKAELKILENNPPDYTNPSDLFERKNGEEMLSDTQVHRRRTNEHNKQVAPYYSKISSLNAKITTDTYRLIHNASIIKHIEDEAIAVNEKIYEHVYQRLDYYWNKCYPLRSDSTGNFPPAIPISTINLFNTKLDDYKIRSTERRRKIESIVEVSSLDIKGVA